MPVRRSPGWTGRWRTRCRPNSGRPLTPPLSRHLIWSSSGLLGIGLPDIPLFTGVLLKSLYQMAARYGYGWDTPAERYYLLLLVQGALSYGEELAACTALLDEFALTPCPPEDYDQGTQIRRTASLLADRLLAMKFVQGIPILGMAGGISDALCLERVQRYAGLNYHHRFLLDHRPDPRPFA